MCGFIASFGQNINHKGLKIAFNQLQRRGPDAEGVWKKDNIFLGSRRLAIFDLHNRSNQPMTSICDRYVLVFNGSIYNYLELRDYLLNSGIKLKTTSDTEVVIELFALEGPKMLSRLQGMFAFVIWDKHSKEAFAARDPFGIKPLYIGYNSDGIILASQVKTLLSTNLISKEKDFSSQFCFFQFGFVIEPRTWFKNIKSLKSGHYIIIKNNKIISEKNWINLQNFWIQADQNKKKIQKKNLRNLIYEELTASVNKHLVADVPIGIFLSSGMDSTLLASIVSKNSKKNITAITVLFNDFKNSDYDETLNAKKIAQKLGLKHFVFIVTKDDFIKDFPNIIEAMDQPSIDGINIWYASKAAAKLKLKVVFSGLGGDEMFFGYNHFRNISLTYKYFAILKKIPFFRFFSKVFFKFYSFIKNDERWIEVTESTKSIFKLWFLKRMIFTKEYILKKNFLPNDKNYLESYNEIFNRENFYVFNNPKIKLSYLESDYYMKNQLLRDSDWASMFHGVELRTPFVDSHLLSKLKNLMNAYSSLHDKEILKKSFGTILPKEFLQKKKTGFHIPIKSWTENYLKKNEKNSKNYLHNYMLDIRDSFNKY
jgi:asparagine synthase (glutamine-hydrolysing)